MTIQAFDVLVTSVLIAVFLVLKDRTKQSRCPPGPPGLPLIGNLLDLPKNHAWWAYQKWGNEYETDIVHIKLCGTNVIVLNSLKSARDLLDRRSAIYSDRFDTILDLKNTELTARMGFRPYSVMLHELTGWGRNIGFMQYGDVWRAHRRSFHQCFHERAVDKYQPFINRRVQTLLRLLLKEPENFIKHIRFSSGALLLELAYGLKIDDEEHPYIEAAERASVGSNEIGNSGGYLVDSVPFLRYLPSWFPGGKFKRQAAEWAQAVSDTYNIPWNDAKQEIFSGASKPSLSSLLLARAGDKLDDFQESVIQNVVGIAFAAGEDTTTATLSTFFLCMLLRRDAQVAAQEELDRVCAPGKLPTFGDREKLPFVTAVMLETLRWHPALPMGVPHRSMADDEYRGFTIPEGTTVMANAWAILHDPDLYPDPDAFNPWRFLDSTGQLREDVIIPDAGFGFGRRMCPGRHFVLQVLWLVMARVLATFNIEKPVDSHGRIIEPSAEFSSGLICYPLPFEAVIKPRSAATAECIRTGTAHEDEADL